MSKKLPKIEGISHFDPSWASRVPRPRLRRLVRRPGSRGGLFVLWIYAQGVLFVVDLVLLGGWCALIVVLTICDAVLG